MGHQRVMGRIWLGQKFLLIYVDLTKGRDKFQFHLFDWSLWSSEKSQIEEKVLLVLSYADIVSWRWAADTSDTIVSLPPEDFWSSRRESAWFAGVFLVGSKSTFRSSPVEIWSCCPASSRLDPIKLKLSVRDVNISFGVFSRVCFPSNNMYIILWDSNVMCFWHQVTTVA